MGHAACTVARIRRQLYSKQAAAVLTASGRIAAAAYRMTLAHAGYSPYASRQWAAGYGFPQMPLPLEASG